MLFLLLAALLFSAEWAIKARVRRSSSLPRTVAGGRLRFLLCFNRGFAGGKCSAHPLVPKLVTGAALVFLSAVLLPLLFARGCCAALKTGCALMMAGSWNNVLDRLIHGRVTDYYTFPRIVPKRLRRFVFNLADAFLLVGALIGLLAVLFGKNEW